MSTISGHTGQGSMTDTRLKQSKRDEVNLLFFFKKRLHCGFGLDNDLDLCFY